MPKNTTQQLSTYHPPEKALRHSCNHGVAGNAVVLYNHIEPSNRAERRAKGNHRPGTNRPARKIQTGQRTIGAKTRPIFSYVPW